MFNVGSIDACDLGFLRERYVDEFPQFDIFFGEASEELLKFLKLPALGSRGPLAAMSHKVDKLWHTLINHTPQYMALCNEAYGRYLHHQPRSERHPVPIAAISNFYTGYPKHFGPVPEIWFDDIPPAHIAAVARGEVPAAVQELKWSGWPGWQ